MHAGQDYYWWWRAFLTPAASALYLFMFSVFYFMPRLQITKFVSICLYTGTHCPPPRRVLALCSPGGGTCPGYTMIIALEFFTLTGVVGFFACYWFVYTIYGSVKVE
jgi:transmembrane 9 superfamily protein 2/4